MFQLMKQHYSRYAPETVQKKTAARRRTRLPQRSAIVHRQHVGAKPHDELPVRTRSHTEHSRSVRRTSAAWQ